jgi:Ca2+-binding RTX toxin-like protein
MGRIPEVIGDRRRFLSGLVAISAVATLVALYGEPVLAKRMVGTNGNDRIIGTAKPDRINARGGNDRVNGRGGGDRLNGSKGKDRIKGAKGKDRLAGGKSTDHLNAVDGKKDRAVNGGQGRDVCRIDQADLPLLKNCAQAKVKNGGGGDGLGVNSASGLTCGSSLPTCPFQIQGDRAEAPVGSVSGGGGVSLAAGAAVTITGDDWTAEGRYGCSASGYLLVTIGSQSVRVPITCKV